MSELEGYLNFIKYDAGKSKTRRFRVKHVEDLGAVKAGEDLGVVKWYAPWRRYAFFPADGTLYDEQCLTEVVEFIRDLMAERGTGRPE